MEQKKKKLIGIIAGAGGAALVALLIIIFTIGGNGARLDKPTGLCVVETQGKKMVCVDALENAKQYRFTITQSGESVQVASLFTHQFDASSYLAHPGEYTISCQYIGQEEFNISPATEITYTSTHKVATPTISLLDNKLNVSLADNFYEAVNLTITLHFTIGQTLHTSANFTTQTDDKRGIVIGYFNLENIFTKAGTYGICVQITTDNDFYLPSDFTQQIPFTFA